MKSHASFCVFCIVGVVYWLLAFFFFLSLSYFWLCVSVWLLSLVVKNFSSSIHTPMIHGGLSISLSLSLSCP